MTEPRRSATKMFDTSLRIAAAGPRGIPVVNNLRFLGVSYRYAMDTMAPFHQQPVVPVTGGNGSMVVAFGDAAVRQVFADNATFQRADGVFNLPQGHPWSKMFEAVITANGDEHRRRRRLLMPVVQKSAMDHYREIFVDTFAGSRFAEPANEQPFDMVDEFLRISKTNMLRGMLGLDDTKSNRDFASDVLILAAAALTQPAVILLRWNRRFTPYGRWVARVASTYDRLATLIEQRRTEPSRPDALSIICNTTDEAGDYLSTAEIAGELHGLFAAGFETTAMTMTWALLTMLAERSPLDPTDATVIDAMVKESQRLLPAVPMSLPRRVAQDVSIGGSAPVPAGSMLFLSAAVEHHNPTIYPEPFAFRPQRWLGQETPRPHSFFPFGIGARRCLGAAFADLQARVTLGGIGTVLPRLRLLTTHVDYRMKTGVTGSPRAPIMVTFGTGTEREPAPTPISGTVNVLWRR